jgi:hypothetical protein
MCVDTLHKGEEEEEDDGDNNNNNNNNNNSLNLFSRHSVVIIL